MFETNISYEGNIQSNKFSLPPTWFIKTTVVCDSLCSLVQPSKELYKQPTHHLAQKAMNCMDTKIANYSLLLYGLELCSSAGATNPCSDNNGNCSHFCLLSASDPAGYTCSCPNGFTMTSNGRNCNKSKRTFNIRFY